MFMFSVAFLISFSNSIISLSPSANAILVCYDMSMFSYVWGNTGWIAGGSSSSDMKLSSRFMMSGVTVVRTYGLYSVASTMIYSICSRLGSSLLPVCMKGKESFLLISSTVFGEWHSAAIPRFSTIALSRRSVRSRTFSLSFRTRV